MMVLANTSIWTDHYRQSDVDADLPASVALALGALRLSGAPAGSAERQAVELSVGERGADYANGSEPACLNVTQVSRSSIAMPSFDIQKMSRTSGVSWLQHGNAEEMSEAHGVPTTISSSAISKPATTPTASAMKNIKLVMNGLPQPNRLSES
jgi:hypothetical protein